MGKRKCDSCGNEINKETEHVLKVPEKECPHCESEVYSEYNFCSKECTLDWLQKN